MDTKKLVYIGVGLVVGYFLVSYFKRAKDNANALGATETAVDQTKIDKCNKEVDDYMASAKFTVGADLTAIRKAKFEYCIGISK